MEPRDPMTDPPNGVGLAATPEVEGALEAMNEMNERVLRFVREQPVMCMTMALGAGFVVAKIADRF